MTSSAQLDPGEPPVAPRGSPAPEADVRGLRTVVLGVLLLGVVRMVDYASPDFAIDDAWISFRVARNWLEHGALTFDVTQPPVEGMTNLLWTLLSASWIALLPGLDPIFGARVVGAACHLATIAIGARLAGRFASDAGGDARVAAAITGAALALSGSMAFHALSGLETPLFTLLFVWSLSQAARLEEGRRGTALLGGVLLGLLGMTRPEGVLAGMLLVGLLLLQRSTRQQALRMLVPFVLIMAATEAFRWSYYGALVPNTYQAKPPDAAKGLRYLSYFLVFGLGVVGPLALVPALRRSVTATRMLLPLGLVMGLASVWSGGDWMPGYRRFSLTMVAFAVLAGMGFALAKGRWRWVAGVGVAGVLGAHVAARLERNDAAQYPTMAWAQLGQVANETAGVETVALMDIGRFGWHFKGSVLDLVGLTDAHIARQRGVHLRKEWDESYFRRRAPALVIASTFEDVRDPRTRVIHVQSAEEGALRSIQQRGGYTLRSSIPLFTGTNMLVFAREGLVLPEELWGPPVSRSFSELELRTLD